MNSHDELNMDLDTPLRADEVISKPVAYSERKSNPLVSPLDLTNLSPINPSILFSLGAPKKDDKDKRSKDRDGKDRKDRGDKDKDRSSRHRSSHRSHRSKGDKEREGKSDKDRSDKVRSKLSVLWRILNFYLRSLSVCFTFL